MRAINKRFKAAYHDHLKNTVNVGDYLATLDQRKLEDSKAQLNAFIRSFKIYEENKSNSCQDLCKSLKKDLDKKI